MTAFYPRKTEKETIIGLLEDDQFESADKLADVILKAAWSAFLERDWFLVAGNMDGLEFGYGLFTTEGGARKALTENTLGFLGGTRAALLHVHSSEKRLEFVRNN